MKVGGNESATKFFQQNGGTAALNSKDPKTKYQSNAATKYKDELKRRAARDAQEYVSTSQIVPLFSADMCLDTPTRLLLLMLPTTEPPHLLASPMTTFSPPGTSLLLSDLPLLSLAPEPPLSSAALPLPS
jgi:hypothetical protein